MITPPAGSGRVEVRVGPGERYSVVDRLPAGTSVTECDVKDGWTGIVYPESGNDTDCGVGSPIPTLTPYAGPCRSGWIPAGTDSVVAG